MFKKDWWPEAHWEHAEPFPLPLPAIDPRPLGCARFHVQRWGRRSVRQRRVVEAIRGLKFLAACNTHSEFGLTKRSYPEGKRAAAMQTNMVASIQRRVDAYGAPPPDLNPELALAELLSSTDFYNHEPQNLAKFDIQKLRVAKGDVVPKDMARLVRPEVAALLRDFKSSIELGADELAAKLEQNPFPKPYWDPSLKRSRSERHGLFKVLVRLGLLGAHTRIKARVGLFFVKKKDGNIRMVCDSRQPNFCHKRPPRTQLGTADCYSELDLADFDDGDFVGVGGLGYDDVHQAGSDVRDCFY